MYLIIYFQYTVAVIKNILIFFPVRFHHLFNFTILTGTKDTICMRYKTGTNQEAPVPPV